MVAVGTSGWSYRHWRGAFYPAGLGSRRWLEFYAERFPAVEVNASFHRLPSETSLRHWGRITPDGFRFVLKGSRLITHTRRLDAPQALSVFLQRASLLGEKLACILWQLPPTLTRDDDRLRRFLEALPPSSRHAVEFRHPSWNDATVFECLDEQNAAHVLVSAREHAATKPVTGGLVYVRFHGLGGGYAHDYTDRELRPWVGRVRQPGRRGADAFAFFNNDGDARAPQNAERFAAMLAGTRGTPQL